MYAVDSDSPASSSSASSSSSWSSPSARSSPVHAASLVDPATHAPALMQLIDIKLDRHVIDYIVDCVAETVDYAMGRTTLPTPSRGRARTPPSPYTLKFTPFVHTVLSRAEVTPATALTALVYIHRARPHLSIALEEWALERVFLGALITASKYTNDSTLKNVHWALCTGVFGKRDVGRIEREFLDVLDWELGVSESDLLAHHEGLLAASLRSRHLASRKTTMTAVATPVYLAPPPRQHGHVRRPSVPELEPSSPQSSLASLSPRTPDVPMDVDSVSHPSHLPYHSSSHPTHHRHPSHARVHSGDEQQLHRVHSHRTAEAGAKTGKLHDLLHSFPIPRSHGRGGGFAIHVNA